MNPLPPGTQRQEKLLGIFDIRKDEQQFEALFRYEIRYLRHRMGGQLIVDGDPTYREEWREITAFGCFPTDQQKYKVS